MAQRSNVRALVQMRQVARIIIIKSAALVNLRDGRWVVNAASFGKQLLLRLALEDFLHRLLRVNSGQLIVILQNIGSDLGRNTVLDGALVLRCNGRTIPFCFLGRLLLLHCSDLRLHAGPGSIRGSTFCHRLLKFVLTVGVNGSLRSHVTGLGSLLFLYVLVPLVGELLLPVLILLDLNDTIPDNFEGLADVKVFHVLIVV